MQKEVKKKNVDLIVESITRLLAMGLDVNDITTSDITQECGLSKHTIKDNGGIQSIKTRFFGNLNNKEFKEIQKGKDNNAYVNKLERELGKALNFEESVQEYFSKMERVKIKPFKSKKKVPIKRAVNAILSDLHIGSDIDSSQTGQLAFGKAEEARRLGRLTKEILEYKSQYRKETTLNVFLLGDIIQNSLHDPKDGAPLAEQVARAIFLLTQMIGQFAQGFPSVTVYCNTGNHGRNIGRHHGRAVNQKWDSIETIVYYALKTALSSAKNVKFVIPKTPYVIAEVFGKKIFATHGDTVLKPGYPSKAINIGSLEHQINKINASLEDKNEYSVFIVGHVHTGSITHLANGAVMITNGAMVPSDEFAVSIGLLENSCGQYVFESVEDFPVGDTRFIRVNEKDDKNSDLEKIITPYTDL